jgi:hypothetical protein
VEAIVNEAQAALNKGKSEPMLLVQEGGNDPFKKADELTKEYGLTACGGEEK